MPLYEYKCRECGVKFEHLGSAAEKAPPCPKCGARAAAKQFSAFAIASQPEGPACESGGCGRCNENPSCPFADD